MQIDRSVVPTFAADRNLRPLAFMHKVSTLLLAVLPTISLAQGQTVTPETALTNSKRIVESVLRDTGTSYTLSERSPQAFVLGQRIDLPTNHGEHAVLVKCQATITWDLESGDGDKGVVQIAVCDRATELPRAKLEAAERLQMQMITSLSHRNNAADVFRDYIPRTVKLENIKMEARYFAVMIVGHGFAIVPTLSVELPDDRRTVLVQLYAPNCGSQPKSSLCSNQTDLLQRLGGAVAHHVAP